MTFSSGVSGRKSWWGRGRFCEVMSWSDSPAPGVAFVALASQEFGSDAAVADVGLRAMAGNAWRIATEDADVV